MPTLHQPNTSRTNAPFPTTTPPQGLARSKSELIFYLRSQSSIQTSKQCSDSPTQVVSARPSGKPVFHPWAGLVEAGGSSIPLPGGVLKWCREFDSDDFRYGLVLTVLKLHLSGTIQCVFFCIWLLLCNITFLRLIQVVSCMHQSPFDGHLCRFRFGIINESYCEHSCTIFVWT